MSETTTNSLVEIKKFLSPEDKPIDNGEFREFWESLTEGEKEEFKTTPLS